jgi:hypothetical protein
VTTRTGPKRCRWSLGYKRQPYSSLCRTRFRPGRVDRLRCRRIGRWSSKRLLPDPCKPHADQTRQWLRSSIVQASWAGCSSGTAQYSYFHNTRRPRTGSTRILEKPGRADRASSCRRSRPRIGVHPGSLYPSCSFGHKRRCCRGKANSPRAGNSDRCHGRRMCGACSLPSLSKRTGHTPCFPGSTNRNQNRHTARSGRIWWGRWPRTLSRAGLQRGIRNGPASEADCTRHRHRCRRRCSTPYPHRNLRNNHCLSGRPHRWHSCRSCRPCTAVRPSTGHRLCKRRCSDG